MDGRAFAAKQLASKVEPASPVGVDADLLPEKQQASACRAYVGAESRLVKRRASAYPAHADAELVKASPWAWLAFVSSFAAVSFAARVSALAFSPPSPCACCGRVEN